MDNRKYSRRSFLDRSTRGLAAAGAMGIYGKLDLPEERVKHNSQKDIIFRDLGKTGVKLPIVSMGVMTATNPEVLVRAYEKGVRHFDTAELYQRGNSEKMIGDVINRMGVRDDVVISTKVWAISHNPKRRNEISNPSSPEKVRQYFIEDFEGCLERLKMDYVDILYQHNVTYDNSVNARVAMTNPGILEALEELKSTGRIKYTGATAHFNMASVLNEAARSGVFDVVQISYNFSMSDDDELKDAIKNAKDNKIGVVAMKTQTGGEGRDKTPINQTAVLKWVLRHEGVTTAIPGFTNFDHLDEDFSVASDLEYTSEEREFLESEDVIKKLDFCRQCSSCEDTCPRNADIPNLMRSHMYARKYGDFFEAKSTLKMGTENIISLYPCMECNECLAKCIRSVNISKNIEELKLLFA